MTICIVQCLTEAQGVLECISETARLDVEMLLAHVLKQARSHLYAWPEKKLSLDQLNRFNLLLKRRLNHEPLAYLLNCKEFWSLNLYVTEDTLIPRPETELLIEIALRLYKKSESIKVADLGTGSGAIALALGIECANWQVVATDISSSALEIAKYNARQLNLSNIQFFQGHWCDPLRESKFDLMISNPPYIAQLEWEQFQQGLQFEPRHALVSGNDGLDAIRDISHNAFGLLNPGGYLLLEHGYQQDHEVSRLLTSMGYRQVFSFCDQSGHKRATLGKR